jgi:hypothetical protein
MTLNDTHWVSTSRISKTDLKEIRKWLGDDKPRASRHTPPMSSTRYALRGGASTPTDTRRFFHVDATAQRKRNQDGAPYPVYSIRVRDGQRGPGPIDAVRKMVHRTLQDELRKLNGGGTASGDVKSSTVSQDVPSSVRNSVAQAVRQNFMCDCPEGTCMTTDKCMAASVTRAGEYMREYFTDAPSVFTRAVTVYVQEEGKKKVREYEGGYRLINNPNKHCIRRGIRKETTARYVRTYTP